MSSVCNDPITDVIDLLEFIAWLILVFYIVGCVIHYLYRRAHPIVPILPPPYVMPEVIIRN